MLSNEQREQFQSRGYLVLENVFSGQAIGSVKNAAQRIVADFDVSRHRTVFTTRDRDAGRDEYFLESAEAVHCFLEEGALDGNGDLNRPKELAINKIGHAMHDLVPAFSDFCRLPVIGQVLRDIGYHAPLLWQTMYIFKQPNIGGEVRWHQDASYLHSTRPGVTGIWIAIEEATRENGCLWMQPGQHHSPLREIYEVDWSSRTGKLQTLDDTPWTSGEAIAVEVPAGSAVLFHDHMPHFSSQNRSDRSRHAFTLHVAESGTAWGAKNWLQRPNLGSFEL
ncbi:MAG: phytanoyl-CoA dioxygenase family protein [Xanthomonadales bacterium]|nr:phytanoyl-CoA dioxygenase family protein [Gammaproteobacteria bacterium]MBT8053760.1 phytanoyl-CoA dioxygenase family protein [Gammaproteobacteria bacterium]NND57297.1 phytanoyl-CoA dioxygenase family protein [Xanthomonadales bacterium]NNK51597.1 phytanoyl-CoA dioxygenase family protein [Xanthomonadales bacterium]